MIDLHTAKGYGIAINPIHIIGLIRYGPTTVVLTDHSGDYATIEVTDGYDHLRSLLEDELYGFERR